MHRQLVSTWLSQIRTGRIRKRFPWRGVAIGLSCAAFCGLLGFSLPFRLLEQRELDRGFIYRGSRETLSKIVIITLDEPTLSQIGKPMMFLSPELAATLSFLDQHGASAIGVDMLVRGDASKIVQLRPGREGSLETMGQAIGLAGNVVLPQWLTASDGPLNPPFEWLAPSDKPWADLGFVDQLLDDDTCVRRQKLRWMDELQNVHGSFALALLIKSGIVPQDRLIEPRIALNGKFVPEDSEGCFRINFIGPPGSVKAISLIELLKVIDGSSTSDRSREIVAQIQGSIVLIGSMDVTMKDQFSVPYTHRTLLQQWLWAPIGKQQSQMSGVELHANALATLIDQAFITTPWYARQWIVLPITAVALGCFLVQCSLEVGLLLTLAHHVLWRLLAFGAFYWWNLHLETVVVYTLGVLLYGTIFMLRWRWIRRMMGLVKSEAIARALESRGAKLKQLGERRELTVLFSDIRSFTTFSEQHSAEDVVRLLNAFFAEIVPIVESEGGTVNTYIGDAVFVIFGAPDIQKDHALRAFRTARAMVNRVREKAQLWQSLGVANFEIGVGVHTGEAIVGTIGSPQRLDYTAIGDTVNTASRLESANKSLGTSGLISQTTFEALPESEKRLVTDVGPARTLQVKGKSQPLVVYAIA